MLCCKLCWISLSKYAPTLSFITRDPYLIISRGPLSLPQDLPPSEEDQSLKVNEVNEDVLKEQCPRDFSTVQEKDVRNLVLITKQLIDV